jgi:hypothetical protein
VTSIGNGTTTITAAYKGKSATTPVAVALASTQSVSVNFTRQCAPFQGKMVITITETSGDIGFTLTALSLTMTDFFHVQRVIKSFTVDELNAQLSGTAHFNASQSKVVSFQQAYAGNVDTQDSTGSVNASFTDDLGHATFFAQSSIPQHDGC